MNKSLLLLLVLVPSFSYATELFCKRSKEALLSYLDQPESRISFKNTGGLIGGGVCWWHSRLQRSSLYLATFKPEGNPPTKPELDFILSSLRSMKSVVVIPGYSDFESFSRDYKKEIQAMLESWQKFDGFYNFEWIRGISGQYQLPADEMKLRMDDVYRLYKKSPAPIWIMAQMKGITSHSFLVTDMQESANGYEMKVIDSNFPVKNNFIQYLEGDSYLKVVGDTDTFVPYVGFQNDFRKIMSTLTKSCGEVIEKMDPIEDGQIE